jgi:hypothetical protein
MVISVAAATALFRGGMVLYVAGVRCARDEQYLIR